jgi:hypothetical protein
MQRNPNGDLRLGRRQFLRAGAGLLALPALEASGGAAAAVAGPRNFVAIGTYLGWHPKSFFPATAGRDFALSPTLRPLADLREQFTVFSRLDHRAPNGHSAWSNFLCGPVPGGWSLDQVIADEIGQTTRFPSLELAAGAGDSQQAMSFTRQGIGLPQINRPTVLYRRLFRSETDLARTEYLLASGKSRRPPCRPPARAAARPARPRPARRLFRIAA